MVHRALMKKIYGGVKSKHHHHDPPPLQCAWILSSFFCDGGCVHIKNRREINKIVYIEIIKFNKRFIDFKIKNYIFYLFSIKVDKKKRSASTCNTFWMTNSHIMKTMYHL